MCLTGTSHQLAMPASPALNPASQAAHERLVLELERFLDLVGREDFRLEQEFAQTAKRSFLGKVHHLLMAGGIPQLYRILFRTTGKHAPGIG